jgi:hypothetical protein
MIFMKQIFQLLSLVILLCFLSCRKDSPVPFLKTDKELMAFGALSGQVAEISISANIEWEAFISPSVIDWLQIDKSAGNGNSKLKVTVTKEYTGNIIRRAFLVIKPKNNSSVPDVTVTIEQKAYENSLLWQKTLGGSQDDVSFDAVATADGSYLVAGHTSSNNGDVTGNKGWTDGWLAKLDNQGNKSWSKTFGGSGEDFITSITALPDGGFAAAGYSNSNDMDVPGNKGEFDFWILRLHNNGTVLWKKNFGGSNDDMAFAMAATPDGGFAVTGFTKSSDGDLSGLGHHGMKDIWLIKLNSSGTLQWQKTLGGSFDESSHAISITADGSIVVAGYAESTDGDLAGSTIHGFHDGWIIKLNNSGTVTWKKTIGGNGNESFHSIANTIDGGLIATGYSQSNIGDVSGNRGMNDAWVVKLNSSGNIAWSKSLGGSKDDGANAVLPQGDGGFVVGGFTSSNNGDITQHHGLADVWTFKLNNNGDWVWGKTFGGSHNEAASFILSTADNNFLTGSYSISTDGDITGYHGLADYWILKFQNR